VIDEPATAQAIEVVYVQNIPPTPRLSVTDIIRVVAEHYDTPAASLKGQRRHRTIALARAVAMYLARTLTEASYPELGRAFGGKHHTTVIAAVEKVKERMQRDAGLLGVVVALESELLQAIVP
jgi:chromosomal replication initiator protein